MPAKAHAHNLSHILRDGGYLYAARLAAQLSRLVYVLLVVRALGAELYGILAYLHAWGLLFLPLVNLGSQPLLSRAFGRAAAEGVLLAQRLWTLRLIALPLLALLLIGIGLLSEPEARYRPLFLIVGTGLIGRGLAIWAAHVLIANRLPGRVLRLEAGFRLGEVMVAAIALSQGAGVAELLVVNAAGWWLQALVSIRWAVRDLVRPTWRWHNLELPQLLRQSLAGILVSITYMSLLHGPVTVGRHVLGEGAALGQFALAMQLLQVFAVMPNVIGVAALPVLANSNTNRIGRQFLTAVPISALLAIGLAGLCMLVGEQVLGWVFGAGFAAAAEPLTLALLILLVPLAPAAMLSHAAMALNRPDALRRAAFAAVGGLVTAIIATALLIPAQGVTGILTGAGTGAAIWLLLLIRIHWTHARTT